MAGCVVSNATIVDAPMTWVEGTFRIADSSCALFTVISACFLLYATSLGFLHPPMLTVANRLLFWTVTVIEALIISNVQAGFIRILVCIGVTCDLHDPSPGSAGGIASIIFIVLWPLLFTLLIVLQAVGIQSMSLFVDVDCQNGMFSSLVGKK